MNGAFRTSPSATRHRPSYATRHSSSTSTHSAPVHRRKPVRSAAFAGITLCMKRRGCSSSATLLPGWTVWRSRGQPLTASTVAAFPLRGQFTRAHSTSAEQEACERALPRRASSRRGAPRASPPPSRTSRACAAQQSNLVMRRALERERPCSRSSVRCVRRWNRIGRRGPRSHRT